MALRADDGGGAIKKRHIDFFVVTYENYRTVIDTLLGVGWVTPHIDSGRMALEHGVQQVVDDAFAEGLRRDPSASDAGSCSSMASRTRSNARSAARARPGSRSRSNSTSSI